ILNNLYSYFGKMKHLTKIKILGKSLNQESALFLGYCLFAGLATLLDWTLFFFLTYSGIHYLISNVFSYLTGITTNFILNKKYNFENRSKQIAKQFSVFLMVGIVGLIFTQILLYVFIDIIHMWYMFAKFLSTFLVLIWSYWGHKKLSFGLYK
ncbi:GtrA family protein, partial [Nanoarchaeota archaeon]